MSKYKVLGNHKVAGVEPGEFVDSDDLQGANLEALVAGGHLETHTKPKATKAEEKD